MIPDGLTIAVPRGALFEPVALLLEAAGMDMDGPRGDSRSLIFEVGPNTIITVRPSDVPTYVETGAADIGITGRDVLVEQDDRDLIELADLEVGRCRMVLAAKAGDKTPLEHERRLGLMRVATKYPRIAERFFLGKGKQVEVVEVKGSVELAPLVGMADAIVDLVATGRTMADNGLEEVEEILPCSARLVANEVSYRLKAAEIDGLMERIGAASR